MLSSVSNPEFLNSLGTYCHLAWHFCRASDARKLERQEERSLKAVYKDKRTSYFQPLERAKLHLSTLANRRLQDI